MKESNKLWTGQYVAIVLMACLFFLCLQLLTAGFPAFITDIKNNPAQGGLMTTVFMVAAIITRPFIGFLIHRVNVKKMSIYSLAFVAITLAIAYNQQSVPLLLLLRVFHGIGFGIMTTILATLATNIIPKKRLGEGIGYYGLATSIGTSMAPMVALALLATLSFNFLLIISVVLAVLTFIFSFFIKPSKEELALTKVEPKHKLSLRESIFDKKAFVPSILCALFSITLGGVISFLRELGKEEHLGGSVSLFFLVVAIVMLAARPVSGRLYDRLGHKVIIYPAAICGIIGLFLLSITHSASTLLFAGFFYGVAYGMVTPTLQAIAVSLVTKEKQGTANAMYFSSMDLGMAIGSTGLGILAANKGFHFIYGFSIVCLVLLLIIYTFLFMKKKESETETVTATSTSQSM
ncbi:MFS transporter [Heyndrickxia sporothermodurans]|uniref:MFS transporter n=1 Tax=Heyndrickxia sporothermodurans TaxID=46224 RepID=UPI002E1D6DD9|nr:MFS transporter [Heyndrickxia sporothermodurans]